MHSSATPKHEPVINLTDGLDVIEFLAVDYPVRVLRVPSLLKKCFVGQYGSS
jgi:hypothetical protein